MSMIIHRCQMAGCGHAAHNHGSSRAGARCLHQVCRAGQHTLNPGRPELVSTFDLHGRPIERILPPGAGELWQLRPCGCQDCQALYAVLTSGTAA